MESVLLLCFVFHSLCLCSCSCHAAAPDQPTQAEGGAVPDSPDSPDSPYSIWSPPHTLAVLPRGLTLLQPYFFQATRFLDAQGRQFMTYVSFSSNELYNWKSQNPHFRKDHQLSHLPIWGDYRQILQVLFTTEESERIMGIQWTLFLGANELPLKFMLISMQPFL